MYTAKGATREQGLVAAAATNRAMVRQACVKASSSSCASRVASSSTAATISPAVSGAILG